MVTRKDINEIVDLVVEAKVHNQFFTKDLTNKLVMILRICTDAKDNENWLQAKASYADSEKKIKSLIKFIGLSKKNEPSNFNTAVHKLKKLVFELRKLAGRTNNKHNKALLKQVGNLSAMADKYSYFKGGKL